MLKEQKIEQLRQEWKRATKSRREIIEMQVKILKMKPREDLPEETPAKMAEEVFGG